MYNKSFVLIILIIMFFTFTQAEPIRITTTDTELYTFTEDFYGIQYHNIAFKDTVATNKLAKLDLKWIRQWAYPGQFHPEPDGYGQSEK